MFLIGPVPVVGLRYGTHEPLADNQTLIARIMAQHLACHEPESASGSWSGCRESLLAPTRKPGRYTQECSK